MDRHDDADCVEKDAEDKMRGVKEERGLSVEVHSLVDEVFACGVAFDHVALEHLLGVAWQRHEVVNLDL